jgi:hypothetical protein
MGPSVLCGAVHGVHLRARISDVGWTVRVSSR